MVVDFSVNRRAYVYALQPKEAAVPSIVATLAPGAHTAIVRGKNGITGVALVEVYALR